MWGNQIHSVLVIALLLAVVSVQGQECLVEHCQICNKPNMCSQCVDKFYVDVQGKCQLCSDLLCIVCPNNPRCQECKSGYYLRNIDYKCRNCLELDCLNCSSSGNCSKCVEGFYLQPSGNFMTCKQCVQGCKTCQNKQKCTVCKDGFFIINLNNINLCQSCKLNLCKTCDSKGNCLSCFKSHFLSTDEEGSTRCFSCIDPNCQICQNSAGICLTCQTGYYHSKKGQIQCQSCAQYGCSVCSGPSNCSACTDGYVLNQTKCQLCSTSNCKFCGYGVCTECMKGYFLKPFNQVLICASCYSINCRSCYNNGTCSQCLSKYFLARGGCMQCKDPFCDNCPGNTCMTCLEGYVIYKNKSMCQPCLQSNCAVCDISGKCMICKSGMYLIDGQCQTCSVSNCQKCQINNTRACSLCQSGYFLKEDRCHMCTENNCSKCLPTNGSCSECLDNFYLNKTSCLKCQLKLCALCAMHEDHLKCQACTEGYFWSSQQKKCIRNLYQAVPTPPLWLMVAALLVIIFVLLFAYRFMLKRHIQRAQNLQQQIQNPQPYMQFQEIS